MSRKLLLRFTPVQLRAIERALESVTSRPAVRALAEVHRVMASDPHRLNCKINQGGTCSCLPTT